MKSHPPVAAELSWAQVHAFSLSRHHLARRAPAKELVRAVGDMGGAQAQLMSAAELQVGVRVECKVQDVRTALWTDRTLVKTWLMRGTLHLVPSADLSLYTAAMQTHSRRFGNAWQKRMQMTEPELIDLCGAIGDALDRGPMSREDLMATVARGRPEHVRKLLKSGWGTVLKPVARGGLLCFGPSRGQSVMGHQRRDHLVGEAFLSRVSRTAGWISAVVLIEGGIAATWSHTVGKQTLRVSVDPFRRLPSDARPEIHNRAEEIAATLGLARVEVTIASGVRP